MDSQKGAFSTSHQTKTMIAFAATHASHPAANPSQKVTARA